MPPSMLPYGYIEGNKTAVTVRARPSTLVKRIETTPVDASIDIDTDIPVPDNPILLVLATIPAVKTSI